MSEPDNSIYNLSKDYERLYGLICDGHVAVGFVDYKWGRDRDNKPLRDVVKIVRRRLYDIFIGVRGCCYGDVLSASGDEKTAFIQVCESLNLEWVEPFSRT